MSAHARQYEQGYANRGLGHQQKSPLARLTVEHIVSQDQTSAGGINHVGELVPTIFAKVGDTVCQVDKSSLLISSEKTRTQIVRTVIQIVKTKNRSIFRQYGRPRKGVPVITD